VSDAGIAESSFHRDKPGGDGRELGSVDREVVQNHRSAGINPAVAGWELGSVDRRVVQNHCSTGINPAVAGWDKSQAVRQLVGGETSLETLWAEMR